LLLTLDGSESRGVGEGAAAICMLIASLETDGRTCAAIELKPTDYEEKALQAAAVPWSGLE